MKADFPFFLHSPPPWFLLDYCTEDAGRPTMTDALGHFLVSATLISIVVTTFGTPRI